MKLLFVVFAALEILAQVTPASGGGTRCGRLTPGYCRVKCKLEERSLFICGRYRYCCVQDIVKPDAFMSKYFRKFFRKKISRGRERMKASNIFVD